MQQERGEGRYSTVTLIPNSEEVMQEMEFSSDIFQNLLLSYIDRLKAVREANGSHTRYQCVLLDIFKEDENTLVRVQKINYLNDLFNGQLINKSVSSCSINKAMIEINNNKKGVLVIIKYN